MTLVALSGVNLGQKKRSRGILYVVLIAFCGCYLLAFYNYHDDVHSEAEISNGVAHDPVSQCKAIFTISSPKSASKKNTNSLDAGVLQHLKERFHHYLGSIKHNSDTKGEELETEGLQSALRALNNARPMRISTEHYMALSEYLPSLLIPEMSNVTHTNDSNGLNEMKEYSEGILTMRNSTLYRVSFLNRTWGFMPHFNRMSAVPENPFSLTSSQKNPIKVIKGKFDVLPYSRLTLSKGILPYIPCKMRFYTLNDLKSCAATRMARNATTWIGFIGDSKVRERFEFIVDATYELDWKIHTFGMEVPWEHYENVLRPQKIQMSMNAYSPIGFNVSILWASRGSLTDTFGGPSMVHGMKEMLEENTAIPDVIVVAFGSWIYRRIFRLGLATITSPDMIIKRWKTMIKVVKKMAKKSTVLLLMQSRYRTHLDKTQVKYNESTHALAVFWNNLLDKELFHDHSNDWIDKVMSTFARETNAIVWDSSLPLNLASIRECGILKQSQQSNHPAYKSILLCEDSHHPSPSTIHDEFTMMLNYLCNDDLNHNEYCCGGLT